MKNPLLNSTNLPHFDKIKPQHVQPAIETLLVQNRSKVAKLLRQTHFTWENLIQPMDEMEDRLSLAWSCISHLNAVVNNPELRTAYDACLPKMVEYGTELGQNEKLYKAIKAIADSPTFNQLTSAQQQVIHNQLRDFHLSGVDLPKSQKKLYAKYQNQLAELMNQFEKNVLDATQSWSRLVTSETELSGIPNDAKQLAHEKAKSKNLTGWLFTLDQPSYLAVMTYADSRQLREEMYIAYTTRASDQGPLAGVWDNTPVINKILRIRYQLAKLLGFNNYAELSLATKTAKHPDDVINFLNELADQAVPIGRKEIDELTTYAKLQHGISKLQPWDILYYSEKLQQHKYAISQEELRNYFPLEQVLQGLFSIVQQLYQINIAERNNIPIWHKDVRFFEIYNQDDSLRGQFYLDLFARENKRSGAWMDECKNRYRRSDGSIQTPVAYLTCNFAQPNANEPALLYHEDVLTLFHEFGHGIHHLLTTVECRDVSGINGVPWDVVEFPSQFMENWCWENLGINLIARHYQTKQPISIKTYRKLHALNYFQAGMQTARQLEFALFDFQLHYDYSFKKPISIMTALKRVRDKISLYDIPNYNRFPHSFAHIFGGSYAAGYYSYKWAEVWAYDAFSKFEEEGILNPKVGSLFLHSILEKGGSDDPLNLFIAFRGRRPKIDALLKNLQAHINEEQGTSI